MAVNVAVDSILDGMVGALAVLVNVGGAVTALKPVRSLARYMGNEATAVELLKRGGAGRTPLVRARFAGTKTLRTTIGRRVDRVESAFAVIVASDNHHSKDFRDVLLALAETVRNLLGSRSFGLAVTPSRYRATRTLIDQEQLMALAVDFAVRHRVDYTVDPGTDLMLEYTGEITNTDPADTKPLQVGIDGVFP